MLPLNLVSGVWHVSQFHIFVSSVKCMGRFHWSFLPLALLPLPGMRTRTRWRRSRAERRRKGVFLYHTNMILSRLSLKSLFRNHPRLQPPDSPPSSSLLSLHSASISTFWQEIETVCMMAHFLFEFCLLISWCLGASSPPPSQPCFAVYFYKAHLRDICINIKVCRWDGLFCLLDVAFSEDLMDSFSKSKHNFPQRGST